MSFDDLPVECTRAVLDLLHWRDLCSVAMTSRGLREVSGDEQCWRNRCNRRFTEAERKQHASEAASTSSNQSWRALFALAVSRARHGTRAASARLAVPDNHRVHGKVFTEALAEIKAMSLECFVEFILSHESSPTLLVLAGLVECMTGNPTDTTRRDEILSVLASVRKGAFAEREIRMQMWVLGRLDGHAPFRLRDDTVVFAGTLSELVLGDDEVWRVMRRGIKHEVRDMEIESVGPPRESFWGTLGT